MAITSTSTISDIKAAYIDNSTYEAGASISMAHAFLQACRLLLLVMPKMSTQDRGSLSLNPEMIQKELASAQQWLAAYSGGGGNRYFSLENTRDAGGGICGGWQ